MVSNWPVPDLRNKTHISRPIELPHRKHHPGTCTSAGNERHHLNLALEKRHAADQALHPPGSIGDPSNLRRARVREGCFGSTCPGPAYWKVGQVYPQEAA